MCRAIVRFKIGLDRWKVYFFQKEINLFLHFNEIKKKKNHNESKRTHFW